MNTPQKIIVDGYNVIHADEKLKRLAGRDLNQARRALLEMIKAYLQSKSLQVTVVFDGRGGLTDADAVLPEKLQVLFSASGRSADTLIIEILKSSANPREYIVVSSDRADIGRAAGGLGARVLASAEFLQRIDSTPPAQSDRPAEKPVVGEEDVDYWLDLFTEPGKKNNQRVD
jgi:ribosomal protection tetracycline resistance protein